jgi:hypothetical protein
VRSLFWLVVLTGLAARSEAAITGVTSGTWDLQVPANKPAGDTWYYGGGMVIQMDRTTAGLVADMRRNGTPYNDYEAGSDLIPFNSLTGIDAARAVPLSRPATEPNPETGQSSLTSVYPVYGGFVPRGAATAGGRPHPHAGTGFGIKLVGFYPAKTAGGYPPFPKPVVYRLEIQQFAYDGVRFTTSPPVRMSAAGLRVGATDWTITAPGFSPAIPDGDDLLFPVLCAKGGNGVARFKHTDDGWRPESFVPISNSGSEASLVRDVDGSLLFSRRDGTSFPLWRSTNGSDWTELFNKGKRKWSPMILNQAADGTPYYTFVPEYAAPARDILQIMPLDKDRTGFDAPITIIDGPTEYGPSPGGQGWDADHAIGNVVRLADGQWHAVLVHRVLARAEHYGGAATPRTGLYVEEVSSSGARRPTWNFVTPEPRS